ncbi:MAG: cysteine--tRNA ligase [Pseudomonadota bacterium]
MDLHLYNTLTRRKEAFAPIDAKNVRMYVCGPTVYDYAHIGNARPVVVFDVLYRLLRHVYGAEHVTYVRNITDVDDKINARAKRDYPDLPLNDAIAKVTSTTTEQFHADIAALGCLPPTHEPRATQHIGGMIAMIETLITRGNAYLAGDEVLFDTVSMPKYGALSKRKLDEQKAGARVAVDAHKKNPGDFVLWKLSSADEPGWDSPWGRGRPGWHIECSVMSAHHLGETFDIHGGGLDLIFPHHENEIAQSCCAHGTDRMANVWMHNGFVQVEGRKMSKSEGNFVTIHDVLHTDKVGGRKWPGEVVRLALLMTHYREPLDFSVKRLEEAEEQLLRWFEAVCLFDGPETLEFFGSPVCQIWSGAGLMTDEVKQRLSGDLGFKSVRDIFNQRYARKQTEDRAALAVDLHAIGLLFPSRIHARLGTLKGHIKAVLIPEVGRLQNDYAQGLINTHPVPIGDEFTLSFDRYGRAILTKSSNDAAANDDIDSQIKERLALIAEKNWAEADRIRDELLEQGIQLQDYKDPETGERKTKWEVKR